jgi:hypothetical protein
MLCLTKQKKTALKTVLKFTADDIAKVEKAKKASEAWF